MIVIILYTSSKYSLLTKIVKFSSVGIISELCRPFSSPHLSQERLPENVLGAVLH